MDLQNELHWHIIFLNPFPETDGLPHHQTIPSSVVTIWLFNIAMENHHFYFGKPSTNGPFSMAMLNNQRVYKNVSQV
jgi:hypothetical protein